jgi:hypothetical protein
VINNNSNDIVFANTDKCIGAKFSALELDISYLFAKAGK